MTAERVRELLEGLGSTPDEVASSLRAAGVSGVRFLCRRCPVANYLRENGVHEPKVSRNLITWQACEQVPPRAVAEFIRRFDQGDPAFRDLGQPVLEIR